MDVNLTLAVRSTHFRQLNSIIITTPSLNTVLRNDETKQCQTPKT
jgi:hypothetical protein